MCVLGEENYIENPEFSEERYCLNCAMKKGGFTMEEIWLQRRVGAATGPPKIVGIISLSVDADPSLLLSQCINGSDWHVKLSPYHINTSYTQLRTKIR